MTAQHRMCTTVGGETVATVSLRTKRMLSMFWLRNKKCSETGPNRRCSGPEQHQKLFRFDLYLPGSDGLDTRLRLGAYVGSGESGCGSVVRICGLMRMQHFRIRTSLVCSVSDPRRLAQICVCGSVRFGPEQIFAVTDSVSEQQRSVRSISSLLTQTPLADVVSQWISWTLWISIFRLTAERIALLHMLYRRYIRSQMTSLHGVDFTSGS